MASNYTSNYNLCQWAASDKVLRTEFNEDNAKIDTALKALDNRMNGLSGSTASGAALSKLESTVDSLKSSKADKSSLDSLTTTVNGLKTSKADKSALDSLKTTVGQHTTALAGKGNCQIYTTTYSGTGAYGADHPTSLTFPKKPLVVFIAAPTAYRGLFIQGQVNGFADGLASGLPLTLSWSGNSVSWYNHQSGANQLNGLNLTYLVVALLQAG